MWTRKSVLALVCGALATTILPAEHVTPSAWAAKHLVVPDGPQSGQLWNPGQTPQLIEIMDHLSPESPVNEVVLRKSAQLGATTLGIAWSGYVATVDPAPMMIVMPTLDSADGFNREKLNPAFEASPSVARRVMAAASRSARASTVRTKRFPGGSIILTGANSTADLRSKTRRYLSLDEIDDWPLDLDGQGDPQKLAYARKESYDATGDWKVLRASTPTIKGESRIDEAFEAGDQRYWEMPCPHCGGEQRFEWGTKDSAHGLKFRREFPHQAHYVCRHNGCVIHHHEKPAMIRAGRWVASCPGPGRYPSYHLDALSSLFAQWDSIVADFLESKDDPTRLKVFWNLRLGLAWEERGDAPDWQRLFARRVQMEPGVVPHGGLVLTCAVDVQKDGLYYEVVAWGRGRTSWVVEAGFLTGDTAQEDADCWTRLSALIEKSWPMATGGSLTIDLTGVDSGYNTSAVYAFVRGRPRAIALKGLPGWTTPEIGNAPGKLDITARGKRKRRGLMVWKVGTWSVKAAVYGCLRKEGVAEGKDADPPGYSHFATHLGQAYFQQLTAEYVKERVHAGRTLREWVARGENHYHDCRVYNRALTHHPLLRLDRFTDDDWSELAKQRDSRPIQPDMVVAMTAVPGAVPETTAEPSGPSERRSGPVSRSSLLNR